MNRRKFICLTAGCAVGLAVRGVRAKGQEKDLAPCGLICGDCEIYRAATDAKEAERLAERWRKDGRKDARAESFKCRGCRGPKDVLWNTDCQIRGCCLERRDLDNCGECHHFPCDNTVEFEGEGSARRKAAVENLRKAKK